MNLLDILNDPIRSAEISKTIDIKLASKDFWKQDEANYLVVMKEIKVDHEKIQMSDSKFNSCSLFPFF